MTSRDPEEANAELERSRERSRRSVAHGATAGTFVVDRINDLPEPYFRDGDVLGYVTPASGQTVRVVVSQDDIDPVRKRLVRVIARIPGQAEISLPAKIDHLPSKALASASGGPIATDPRDTAGSLRKRSGSESELFARDAVRYPDRAANRHCDGSLQSPAGRCAVHLRKFLLRFWNFIVQQEFGRPDRGALCTNCGVLAAVMA